MTPAPRTVTREDFERGLRRVRELAVGENEGLFGPGSMSWRLDREAVTFLGGGRALLLQLAHPWVGAGVTAHSKVLADPLGRFHRTFESMFTMVFGTLDQAEAMARRLYRRHEAVRGFMPAAAGPFALGSPYWANEAGALAWVHATLADSAFLVHETVFGPLDDATRERWWSETRRFALYFGLREEDLPADYGAFRRYMDEMAASEVLTVIPAARDLALDLLGGRHLGVAIPGWYRALTARLLPIPVRERFGLDYGPEEARAAKRALAWVRRLYPALPDRLRYVGPYQEATARLAGRRRPDLATRGLNRLWIGRWRMGE